MTAREIVRAYYAWAAREAERQRVVAEADALESIGGEEVRAGEEVLRGLTSASDPGRLNLSLATTANRGGFFNVRE